MEVSKIVTDDVKSFQVGAMTARDPKDVAREVEADGQDGMNAPFSLPASECGLVNETSPASG